jgi:hypothetical protein
MEKPIVNLQKKKMKKTIIPLALILALMISGCEKQQLTTDCLQVKIVRITCANTVLQVLNNSSIGEDGWKDTFNNNVVYDNVFTAANSCHIPSEYKTGDVLYITIAKPSWNDCVKCALFDAPPKVTYDVKTMGNLPCNEKIKG